MREQAYESVLEYNNRLRSEHLADKHFKQMVFGCPLCSALVKVEPQRQISADQIKEIERIYQNLAQLETSLDDLLTSLGK